MTLSEQSAYPQKLLFATAVGCGLLLAVATHMICASFGFALSALWNNNPGVVVHASTAIAWWMIAAVGFAGGYGAAILMARTPGTRVSKLLRRTLQTAFFIIIAGAGLAASEPQSGPGAANVLAGLAAALLGTGMALCGAHFAARASAT